MISDLLQRFTDPDKKLPELISEVKDLMNKKKDSETDKVKKTDKKPILSKSIQPLTRMRSSIEEAKTAQENPEIQFVKDRLGDIFK